MNPSEYVFLLLDTVKQLLVKEQGKADYAYSKTLASLSGKWTYEELNKFLYKPKLFYKGTKMNYAGLSKTKDRADLIAWLRTKSDSPVALP